MIDTIIIGAGISGPYTNYLLGLNNTSKSKSDILILEGRDRTGGRIKSLQPEFSLGKNMVEAGATRISDKHNRVLKLLEKFGKGK